MPEATPEATPDSTRRGPRPLALYLGTATAVWQSSKLALPLLRHCSAGQLPPRLAELEALREPLSRIDTTRLEEALEREIARRAEALNRGVTSYRRHPHWRRAAPSAVAWQEGTSRLIDFAPEAGGRPILLIPSLINRAYILDLDEENGLCRWLVGQGFRPFLVDWDAPAEEERAFTLTDYVAGRLSAMLGRAEALAGARPVALGYCLGGLLALGLAQLHQERLAGLALLATPWDFHADLAIPPAQMRMAGLALAPLMDSLGVLPTDAVQTLFYSLDPWLTVRKFIAFGAKNPKGSAARAFVALEDWLNDGVPLAAPVAREVLAGWYAENRPARGLWRLAGQSVDPASITLPSLVMAPNEDRIVPPASALALARALPAADLRQPAAGHIGMIVGRNAKRSVWQPLVRWARALPA